MKRLIFIIALFLPVFAQAANVNVQKNTSTNVVTGTLALDAASMAASGAEPLLVNADGLANAIGNEVSGTGDFARTTSPTIANATLTGTGNLFSTFTYNLALVSPNAIGSVAGGGTITLSGTKTYNTVTVTGSTSTVALPTLSANEWGVWKLRVQSAYDGGAHVMTIPDGLYRLTSDIDTVSSSTTISIPATTAGYVDLYFAAENGTFMFWDTTLPQSIALTTGNVYTGTHDFGGATAIEIENSNDPDVAAIGQISQDANGNWLRAYDGTNQFAFGQKITTIQVTVIAPNDLADAQRDAFLCWSNESGMSFIVTGWKGWAGTDDTTLNIEEVDADGVSNNATVDAVELATGTGPFTGSDTTITGATIENGHMLVLDFDDTDTPTYVKMTIYGYFNADVN